jgi:hypothetical protein
LGSTGFLELVGHLFAWRFVLFLSLCKGLCCAGVCTLQCRGLFVLRLLGVVVVPRTSCPAIRRTARLQYTVHSSAMLGTVPTSLPPRMIRLPRRCDGGVGLLFGLSMGALFHWSLFSTVPGALCGGGVGPLFSLSIGALFMEGLLVPSLWRCVRWFLCCGGACRGGVLAPSFVEVRALGLSLWRWCWSSLKGSSVKPPVALVLS